MDSYFYCVTRKFLRDNNPLSLGGRRRPPPVFLLGGVAIEKGSAHPATSNPTI
jgi:hypothetical protein